MVPEKGAHMEELDERLVEARDEVLLAGERIVAQESGDQGQAIVLTDSRIIVLKAGITATGTLNGRKISICPYGNITKISVRKGPVGAVIQVCGSETKLTPGERPPENLVVFSGAEKVKRCDAIAQKIEEAIGMPVDRIEPTAQASAAPPAEEAPAMLTPKKRAPRKAKAAETPVMESIEAVAEIVEPAPAEIVEPMAELAPEVVEETTEPAPAKRRGGRVAKSLAEEMYGDYTPAAPAVSAPPPAPVVAEVVETEEIAPVAQAIADVEPEPEIIQAQEQPVIEAIIETIPEPEPIVEPVEIMQEIAEEPAAEIVEPEPEVIMDLEPKFRPNPNLPKPGRRSRGSNKVLVGIGTLTVFVLLGVAVMGPIQRQKPGPDVVVNIDQVTNNANLLRKQHAEILDYNARMMAGLRRSDSSVASVRSAVASGNAQSVASAISRDATDAVLAEITALPAPLGLAGAKESVLSGLFKRKAAVESAGGPATETLSKLNDSDAQIRKGTASIQAMLLDLSLRISKRAAK